MQIATWNVNSLNVRLPHVLDWLEKNPVDALALQETKTTDDKFPVEAIEEAGYQVVYTGQKTYNGVALLTKSKSKAEDVVLAMPDFEDDHKRVIGATVDGVRVIGLYCPNGKDLDNPSFDYKLAWFEALHTWLVEELKTHDKLVLTGDFNIAPRDEDTYDPEKWAGRILCSPQERAALDKLLNAGLADCWRLFDEREGRHRFTWWDYRNGGWARNAGLRIDHVLATPALVDVCSDLKAFVGERGRKRPSDHVPVVGTFDLA